MKEDREENSLFSSSIFDAGNTSKQEDNETKEKSDKPFPPPINTLFSFDLPGLAASSKDSQPLPKAATVDKEPAQVVRVNKSGFILNTLESNAQSYLKTLNNQGSDDKDEDGAGNEAQEEDTKKEQTDMPTKTVEEAPAMKQPKSFFES